MIETTPIKNQFLSAFEQFERDAANADAPWLRPLRQAAIARFAELGFPGKRNEDWKFTSLTGLQNNEFRLCDGQAEIDSQWLEQFTFSDCHQLVIVNGHFRPDLSNIGHLKNGIVLCSLAEAMDKHSELVSAHLARYAKHDDLALTALNTSFLRDGSFIYLPKNAVLDKPIHLIQINAAESDPVMAFPRHLLVADQNSQATVVESHLGRGEQSYFTNCVVEVYLGENARVDHYKVVREGHAAFHIANLQVYQEPNSNFFSHYFALSGGLLRNESRTLFAGQNSECTFNGLYLGRDRQHIDNHTVIDHAQPHCHSYEIYKGLLDDHAHGVFNGKIFVREDAQKTDAKQSNQCILLSDDAVIDTKPQLEIFADDVKCTHGATVGQLDETSLFYLRSRGISENQARSLLIYAFANDLIQRIKVDPIRIQLEDFLLTRQDLPRLQEI